VAIFDTFFLIRLDGDETGQVGKRDNVDRDNFQFFPQQPVCQGERMWRALNTTESLMTPRKLITRAVLRPTEQQHEHLIGTRRTLGIKEIKSAINNYKIQHLHTSHHDQ
jgi:hypothetical protein